MIRKKKIVSFIIGGPNKYFDYSDQELHKLFTKIKTLFTPDKFKIVIIPSYRTPEDVIKKTYDVFSSNHHVVKTVDKKAYLSSLAIADFLVVTCDSTSMISEAAVTGKPVYIAMMKPKKSNTRFKKFYFQLSNLGITKELNNVVENWSYESLNEVNRIAPLVKSRMKQNGII